MLILNQRIIAPATDSVALAFAKIRKRSAQRKKRSKA